MAKPSELAVLEINGLTYQDWETVTVRQSQMKPPFFSFRFTCSEASPLATDWDMLRIKPGDPAKVTLAGHPAVAGYVDTRQAFYDGSRHYVEIQGSSTVAGLAHSSAISKTMEFKNVTFEQYARALLRPFNINLVVQGGQLPQTRFPRLSLAHGMTVLEALEMPLRSLGHFPLTSNARGDLVIIAGPSGGEDTVAEGANILEGREIIYNNGIAKGLITLAQHPGSDQVHGAPVASVPFVQQDFDGLGLISRFLPAVVPMETPAHQPPQLQARTGMDNRLMNEDRVTVIITVQGWLRPSGGLWQPDQKVRVISPMLLMTGSEDLHAKSVTFSQDNERGSRTLLELCNDAAMFGRVPTANAPGSGQQQT